VKYTGSCHCKAVQFEIEAPVELECHECNCSICGMTGYLHLIVPRSRLTLIRGRDALSTYTFNTHAALHYFCKICGIKPFYVPRSNPDGYSVNVRCLTPKPETLTIIPFDGRHWERNAAALEGLSK